MLAVSPPPFRTRRPSRTRPCPGHMAGTSGKKPVGSTGVTLTLEQSVVSRNRTRSTDGDGGDVYNDTGGTVVFTDSRVELNTAGRNGGGIYTAPGGMVSLTATRVTTNTAGGGGHLQRRWHGERWQRHRLAGEHPHQLRRLSGSWVPGSAVVRDCVLKELPGFREVSRDLKTREQGCALSPVRHPLRIQTQRGDFPPSVSCRGEAEASRRHLRCRRS